MNLDNVTKKRDLSLKKKAAITPPRFDAQKTINHQSQFIYEEEKIAPKISEEEAVGAFGNGFNGNYIHKIDF